MKTPYSILIAIFAFVLLASPVAAQVGTQWSRQINNPNRFKVLGDFSGKAVLDRETGLVWEQSPLSPSKGETGLLDWESAQSRCNGLTVCNRMGWRLPTIQELASQVDPSVGFPGPTLPAGHPFIEVQSSDYWSATTVASSGSSRVGRALRPWPRELRRR